MQTQNDQLDSEIIPALYEVLPDAFPEFGFKKTSKGYKSTTTRKVSGEDGDREGAVTVLSGSPYYFGDFRGGGKAIYSYIKERDGLTAHHEVVRKLAELAGVAYREQQLSPEDEERFRRANKQAELWEAANDFFINCLSLASNPYANTDRAKQVQEYLMAPLERGGRNYAPSLFRLPGQAIDRQRPRMELGFIPDVLILRDYLIEQGYDNADVTPLIRGLTEVPEARIGKLNVLTFPYRDHVGKIKGMVFRSLSKDDKLKYLYSPGLQRQGILFNLSSVARNSDLVVVESPLDAMHASALGISNITALGGSGDTLNKAQVDLAIRYGATKITLMLDNDSQDGIDRAGARGTDRAITFLQKEYPRLRVYVGQYPDGVKDLDELLSGHGVEGFYRIKDDALPSWSYQLGRLYTHYSNLADPSTGTLSWKQIDNLKDDVIELGSKLSPLDKDALIHDFVSDPQIITYGVTKQTIDEAAVAIRKAEFAKKQSDSLQSLLKVAKQTGDSDVNKALDELIKEARQIKSRDKEDSFAALSSVLSEQELKNRIQGRPEPLESGFEIDGEPLLIPAAAVSIVAGATSHGKSILIANLAINLAQIYDKLKFHIFTYEVDEEQYLVNLLNPYIGDDELAISNRESLDHYFRGKTEIKRRDRKDPSKPYEQKNLWKSVDKKTLFEAKKAEFFRELIDKGRIKVHYVTYDSDTLIDAIRHIHKTEPLGAVLIDYIQLINLPVNRLKSAYVSRQEEIKQMCQDFKDLIIETGLPLIFAAQFNRDVQSPFDMHATKLGEAGDLERIANLVLGVWNNSRKWDWPTTDKAREKVEAKIPFKWNDKLGVMAPDPKTWYVEVLKRRGGRVEVFDIWDYFPNAGKVSSYNQ